MNLQWLEELCALPGVSGREEQVRGWLIERLPADVPYTVDPLGNLIVNPQNPGVMLCAHMDEVGMIVTDVTDEGFLRFAHVGGIDRAAYLGAQVLVGAARTPGVVGLTPIHLLESGEARTYPKQDSLLIDIGAAAKDEALGVTRPGDFVTFALGFTRFGDGFIKARALDDRLGCLLLLELLHAHHDICAVFSAREEIGGAASAAAFALRPRYAIVLETTTAADLPGVDGADRVCRLGGGAVVPFMDSGTVYPFDLYELALSTANRLGIPVQTKTRVAGGNDARGIQASAGGVPVLAVSVPCRNLHSPSVVAKESDAGAVYGLAEALLKLFTKTR